MFSQVFVPSVRTRSFFSSWPSRWSFHFRKREEKSNVFTESCLPLSPLLMQSPFLPTYTLSSSILFHCTVSSRNTTPSVSNVNRTIIIWRDHVDHDDSNTDDMEAWKPSITTVALFYPFGFPIFFISFFFLGKLVSGITYKWKLSSSSSSSHNPFSPVRATDTVYLVST